MRPGPLVVLALLTAGCGARSSLPEPSVSQIDKLTLTQGTLSVPVTPVAGDTDVVSFYAYTSASAHTGFEALGKSEIYLYQSGGVVSLVTEHGIDQNSSGMTQPESLVNQAFEGLPAGVTVALADDDPTEFFMDSPTSAQGKWHFNGNTDGGVLSGLPLPGSWSVTITPDFIMGIDTWRFLDDTQEVPLDLEQPVTLTASSGTAP